jgi:hypothetical protein
MVYSSCARGVAIRALLSTPSQIPQIRAQTGGREEIIVVGREKELTRSVDWLESCETVSPLPAPDLRSTNVWTRRSALALTPLRVGRNQSRVADEMLPAGLNRAGRGHELCMDSPAGGLSPLVVASPLCLMGEAGGESGWQPGDNIISIVPG